MDYLCQFMIIIITRFKLIDSSPLGTPSKKKKKMWQMSPPPPQGFPYPQLAMAHDDDATDHISTV